VLLISVFLLISTTAALSLNDLFAGSETGDVAIIDLSGTIVPTAGGFTAGITPEEVRELNQQASSRNVDAIVYEINSGGGAVVASKDVKRNIEAVDVPTICRIRDVGASGAYLFSLGCDSIVADSASMTGSIGVTSSYLEFSDLMEEVGVSYVNITVGEDKELGSPYQEPTEEEIEELKDKAEIIGDEFLNTVTESRNLTASQRETVSTGEVFLGSEAYDLDLVDRLGGRNTAIVEAENITGMDLNPVEVSATQSTSLLSLFLPGLEIGSNSPLKAIM